MEKYSIVYSSATGNTGAVAEAIRRALPEDSCVYCGGPEEAELSDTDLIFAGFWTDKGSCSADMAGFLKTLAGRRVALFGTAGFGGSAEYYEGILSRVQTNLPEDCCVEGTFMCQGKMPQSVRKRYEAMLSDNPEDVKNRELIENFDRAATHPDEEDLREAGEFARGLIGRG